MDCLWRSHAHPPMHTLTYSTVVSLSPSVFLCRGRYANARISLSLSLCRLWLGRVQAEWHRVHAAAANGPARERRPAKRALHSKHQGSRGRARYVTEIEETQREREVYIARCYDRGAMCTFTDSLSLTHSLSVLVCVWCVCVGWGGGGRAQTKTFIRTKARKHRQTDGERERESYTHAPLPLSLSLPLPHRHTQASSLSLSVSVCIWVTSTDSSVHVAIPAAVLIGADNAARVAAASVALYEKV
jgi:hypothetical protein